MHFEHLQKIQLPQPQIKLEERVKRTNRLTATTPGTMAAKNVSDTSRADYSIYSIAAGGPVLAVILEAKTTQHPKFTHALGQVHFNSPITLTNNYHSPFLRRLLDIASNF